VVIKKAVVGLSSRVFSSGDQMKVRIEDEHEDDYESCSNGSSFITTIRNSISSLPGPDPIRIVLGE
jgi:hypothetical protein